jgi:hypothetical protein
MPSSGLLSDDAVGCRSRIAVFWPYQCNALQEVGLAHSHPIVTVKLLAIGFPIVDDLPCSIQFINCVYQLAPPESAAQIGETINNLRPPILGATLLRFLCGVPPRKKPFCFETNDHISLTSAVLHGCTSAL